MTPRKEDRARAHRPRGQISGKKADELRRNRARLAALLAPAGPGSGGAGDAEVREALLLAALGSSVGRGGLGNQGALARAALFHGLRKRGGRGGAEGFFAEEHVGYAPEVAMGGLGLLRGADARVVADVLGLDVQRVREVQEAATLRDVDRALRADHRTGRIEGAARAGMGDGSPDPDTPPEHQWRRGAGGSADTAAMNPRELALHWLSAANSREPGAREAQERFFAELAEKHPQLAESMERHMLRDPHYTGSAASSRIDANSVMAGASPQADGRPLETMEEYWAKAVPWFKDHRADLNKLRDDAESLTAAVLNGRVPGTVLVDVHANAVANKSLPGFAEDHERNLGRARARAAAGASGAFPQGDALLDTFDRARGYPANSLPDRAGSVAAGNAAKDDLRAHDATRALGPALVLGDSRLPVTGAQLARARDANGGAVLRPEEERALGADAREGAAQGGAVREGAARGGAADPRARAEGQRERREKQAAVARTRAQAALYRRGEAARAARDSPRGLPTGREQRGRAAGRLTAVHEGQRRRDAVTTTRTRTTRAR